MKNRNIFSKGSSVSWLLLGIFFVLFTTVLSARFLSGDEDTWLCSDGVWVKHGVPSAPQPTTPCSTSANANNFSKEGNLKIGKGPVWTLLYEEPGSPAISASLSFLPNAVCKKGLSSFPCEEPLWAEGARAKVEGIKKGNEIKVSKLTTY